MSACLNVVVLQYDYLIQYLCYLAAEHLYLIKWLVSMHLECTNKIVIQSDLY